MAKLKQPRQTGLPSSTKSSQLGFSQVEGQKITALSTLGFVAFFNKIMPDPDAMLRMAGIPVTGLKNLEYDPRVFSACEQRVAKTKMKDWALDKGKAKSATTKLTQKMLERLDVYGYVDQSAQAWKYGFKLFEVVKTFEDGILWPKPIGHPTEFFIFNATGQIQWRTIHSIIGEDLPEGDYILLVNRGSQQNPYGEKVLSRVYWWVNFKREMCRYRQIMGENFGLDAIFLSQEFDKNSTQAAMVKEGILGLLSQRVGIFPKGVDITTIASAGRSGADVFSSSIDYDDNSISEAILTQALTQNTQQTGTYGSKMVGQENEYNVSESDERTLYVPFFKALINIFYKDNFPAETQKPEFCFYEEDEFQPDAQQIGLINAYVNSIVNQSSTPELVKSQMVTAFPEMPETQIDDLIEKAVAAIGVAIQLAPIAPQQKGVTK
jgi:phage gp29-like protein